VKQSLSYAEKEREIDLKEREAIVYRAESLQREFEHVNKLLQVCLFYNSSNRTFKCSKILQNILLNFKMKIFEIILNYLEHENHRRCSVTLYNIDQGSTDRDFQNFVGLGPGPIGFDP